MLTRYFLLINVTLFLVAGCARDKESDTADKESQETTTGSKQKQATESTMELFNGETGETNAAATNTGNVPHYICANNCEGSGSDQPGNCPVCGGVYQHNAAFHNAGNLNTNDPTTIAPPPVSNDPPQNARGVWHYVCANGCAGGSGTMEACATCGAMLQHNAAYHN